ncbi:hypothetical protein [Aestuariivita boseongensis]|uniref:hypothetical protein n=1 Tax=Aestuariivita boseongensis TaxID=1470562 RepID=UPI000680CBC6|nr:hypothetical protein [Aestuariivita boseongensis]
MTSAIKALITIAALSTLAACVETSGGGSASQMPVAPNSPPFITTMSGSVSQASINACRNTLAAQTVGGVTVVGGETSEAATAIYMRVGQNGAPWRCLVGADGSNPSVMFMGSEGTL